MCFAYENEHIFKLIALMNSNSFEFLYRLMSATMDFNQGPMRNIPYAISSQADALAQFCIKCAKEDWNSFETSWNFKKHPMI